MATTLLLANLPYAQLTKTPLSSTKEVVMLFLMTATCKNETTGRILFQQNQTCQGLVVQVPVIGHDSLAHNILI